MQQKSFGHSDPDLSSVKGKIQRWKDIFGPMQNSLEQSKQFGPIQNIFAQTQTNLEESRIVLYKASVFEFFIVCVMNLQK